MPNEPREWRYTLRHDHYGTRIKMQSRARNQFFWRTAADNWYARKHLALSSEVAIANEVMRLKHQAMKESKSNNRKHKRGWIRIS